jgi:membrane-associated phospholipid phosphatase
LRRAFVFFFSLVLFLVVLGRPASAGPWPSTNDKMEWKTGQWPRVTPWEAAGTLATTAFTLWLERAARGAVTRETRFEVPLLDPGARWLLRGSEKAQLVFSEEWSDYGFRMMAYYPYIMDVGVAAIGIHRNFDVAGQLALIDLQALTLSGFTFLLASRFTGRARPYRQDCPPGGGGKVGAHECFGPDNQSFYSGHAAAAFTSAGLTCVAHQHLPLFGGGPIETWACVWGLTVATATGVFRIIGDEHHASDVLMGAGIGWFYGYVMPKLLHFKDGKLEAPKERKAGDLIWMPSFNVLDGGGILSIGTTL